MSELDDLLAQLDDDGGGGGNSEAFTKLREHSKGLEKDLKDERKARTAFESRVAELEQARRSDETKSLFRALEIKPELADLFLASHKDAVSEDVIREWATKYGFLQEKAPEQGQEGQQSPPPQPPRPEGNRPVAGNEPPAQLMKIQDWNALYRRNPARAMQMAQDGLVEGLDQSVGFGEAGAVASF